MIRFTQRNEFTTALYALMTGACFLALCGCSGYFTPWSAFQPVQYDLGSNTFAPDAVQLVVPDSVSRDERSQTPAAWCSFTAFKDTTYVATLYPQFRKGSFDLFDTSTQSSVVSVKADTGNAPRATIVWTCKKDGAYYLRIGCDSVTYGGSVPTPGPFKVSVKTFDAIYGSIVDAYEPDGTPTLATRLSFTSGNAAEVFQYHRTAPKDTDWFVFSPNDAHTYEIHTVGNADTRISLLAQGKDSVEVSDDNSGEGKNARLFWTCPYSSGSYARYFFVTGLTEGAYGISIVDRGF